MALPTQNRIKFVGDAPKSLSLEFHQNPFSFGTTSTMETISMHEPYATLKKMVKIWKRSLTCSLASNYEQLKFNEEVHSLHRTWTLFSEMGSCAEQNFTSMEHENRISRWTRVFRISSFTVLESGEHVGSYSVEKSYGLFRISNPEFCCAVGLQHRLALVHYAIWRALFIEPIEFWWKFS